MKAYIKQVESISQTQCVVLAQVIHARDENIADNLGAVLSESTDREFTPVVGSASVIQDGQTSTFVRAIMQRNQEVLPADHKSGMSSVSANMYMDKSDKLWSLRISESGEEVLMRESNINDNNELIDMIRSVSSATPTALRAQHPTVALALAQHEAVLAGTTGGDMCSYVSASGATKVGFCYAQIEDLGQVTFGMVAADGSVESVSSHSLVARLDADQMDANQFPDVSSLSSAVNVDEQKLVDYYNTVFRYSPEYAAKMEALIRNYSF